MECWRVTSEKENERGENEQHCCHILCLASILLHPNRVSAGGMAHAFVHIRILRCRQFQPTQWPDWTICCCWHTRLTLCTEVNKSRSRCSVSIWTVSSDTKFKCTHSFRVHGPLRLRECLHAYIWLVCRLPKYILVYIYTNEFLNEFGQMPELIVHRHRTPNVTRARLDHLPSTTNRNLFRFSFHIIF